MAVILQVNYTPSEAQQQVPEEQKLTAAHHITELSGFKWKVWINNQQANLRGGIYLFENSQTAKAWADQLTPRLEQSGGRDISVTIFDVDTAPSALTLAPLQ